VAQREADVDPVLVRQRRRRDLDAGQVDALVVLEDPAGDHEGVDLAVADVGHREAEVAVVEQDLVADLDVARQALVGRRHAALVADDVVGGDRELGARPELDLAGGQLADPDLGALEVEQHGDRLAAAIGLGADDLEHPRMIVVTSMRKVEPGDAHSGVDQLADALRRRRGGPQRADDLRAWHDAAQ
jgi:hypothetical protein